MDDRQTDADWEHFGATDPYWAVLTEDRFRKGNLGAESRRDFFTRGERHIEDLFAAIRGWIDPDFAPQAALDFGCGVGRLLLPLAARCRSATGIDVSDAMLRESRVNADARAVTNLHLVKGDDELSGVTGPFDFIHSSLVFQHIPPRRGTALFLRLLDLLADGGVGALHFVFALREGKAAGVPPRGPVRKALGAAWRTFFPSAPPREPLMQMNPYDLSGLLWTLQDRGVSEVHLRLTGPRCVGAFLLFRKPLAQCRRAVA